MTPSPQSIDARTKKHNSRSCYGAKIRDRVKENLARLNDLQYPTLAWESPTIF